MDFLSGIMAKSVCWYWMDEGAGLTLYDHSGNGNDGTLSGPTWGSSPKGAKLGFDGSDDVVTTSVIPIGGAYTFAFIVSLAHADYHGVDRGFIWLDALYGIDISSEAPLIFLGADNFMYFSAAETAAYLDGLPHLWIVDITGFGQNDILNASLKIDNVTISQGASGNTTAPSAWTKFTIGQTNYGYLKGGMSFLAAIPGTLDASEKTELYSALMLRKWY